MKTVINVLLLVALLVGCASEPQPATYPPAKPELSANPLQFYAHRLANGLFSTLVVTDGVHQTIPSVAVASFLPVNSLTLTDVSPDELTLANQLSESMIAEARAFGLQVYEYRLRNHLLLQQNHEQAFSRLVDDIRADNQADTILSGTYAIKEDSIIVNVRLIDISSKQVIAAATDYIPANVFWSEQQIIKRGQYLYRRSIYGDKK